MKPRRATVIVLAGCLGGAALSGGVASASAAAKPGLRYVEGATATDTKPLKSLTVKCPRGYRAVDGGSQVTGRPGDAVLFESRPFHGRGGDGYVVGWRSGQGVTDHRWAVRGRLVCASGLSGVRIVSKTAPSSVTGSGRVVVNCGRGLRFLGSGGRVTGTGFEMGLHGLGPARSGKAGYAFAENLSEDSVPPWRLTAYAVCAKPPAGWRLSTWTSSTGAARTKTHVLRCAPGTRPFGGGAEVLVPRYANVVRFDSTFVSPGGSWAAASVVSHDPASERWRLRVHAVCAR